MIWHSTCAIPLHCPRPTSPSPPSHQAQRVSRLRGLPPYAGALIWARQLERQVDLALRRLEEALGPEWALRAEGAPLNAMAERFRAVLSPHKVRDSLFCARGHAHSRPRWPG